MISAIMTAHREGLLAGPSIASFLEAVCDARRLGLKLETLAVLDRPDKLTESLFRSDEEHWNNIVVSDYGDPALTRNRAIEECTGKYVTFLDADDLWSYNWISESYKSAQDLGSSAILHSDLNVIFGDAQQMWLHADSTSPSFDPGYLSIGNYWDALTFCERQIYVCTPYLANDLREGYGHEDWHWNCATLLNGYEHLPVPDTVHFKRRRIGSQSAAANDRDVIPWATEIRFLRHWKAI